MLFSGTIRSNVDPMDQAGGDAAVWQSLQQAGLSDAVKGLEVCTPLPLPLSAPCCFVLPYANT